MGHFRESIRGDLNTPADRPCLSVRPWRGTSSFRFPSSGHLCTTPQPVQNYSILWPTGQAYLALISTLEAEKRGSDKGYTTTHVKRAIAAKLRVLNWCEAFSRIFSSQVTAHTRIRVRKICVHRELQPCAQQYGGKVFGQSQPAVDEVASKEWPRKFRFSVHNISRGSPQLSRPNQTTNLASTTSRKAPVRKFQNEVWRPDLELTTRSATRSSNSESSCTWTSTLHEFRFLSHTIYRPTRKLSVFENKTYGAAPEWGGGRGKRETPEKACRLEASSGTIHTCENPGVARPGIEPGSPWWEASSLTNQPPRPQRRGTREDQGEPGSIPDGVKIVPDDAAGRRAFSGISRFPRSFHSGDAAFSPRFTLVGYQDILAKRRPENISTTTRPFTSWRESREVAAEFPTHDHGQMRRDDKPRTRAGVPTHNATVTNVCLSLAGWRDVRPRLAREGGAKAPPGRPLKPPRAPHGQFCPRLAFGRSWIQLQGQPHRELTTLQVKCWCDSLTHCGGRCSFTGILAQLRVSQLHALLQEGTPDLERLNSHSTSHNTPLNMPAVLHNDFYRLDISYSLFTCKLRISTINDRPTFTQQLAWHAPRTLVACSKTSKVERPISSETVAQRNVAEFQYSCSEIASFRVGNTASQSKGVTSRQWQVSVSQGRRGVGRGHSRHIERPLGHSCHTSSGELADGISQLPGVLEEAATDLEAGVQTTPKGAKDTGEDMLREGTDSCDKVGPEFFGCARVVAVDLTGRHSLVCCAADDTISLVEHRLNARDRCTHTMRRGSILLKVSIAALILRQLFRKTIENVFDPTSRGAVCWCAAGMGRGRFWVRIPGKVSVLKLGYKLVCKPSSPSGRGAAAMGVHTSESCSRPLSYALRPEYVPLIEGVLTALTRGALRQLRGARLAPEAEQQGHVPQPTIKLLHTTSQALPNSPQHFYRATHVAVVQSTKTWLPAKLERGGVYSFTPPPLPHLLHATQREGMLEIFQQLLTNVILP
ncbi:hypothetical protein PR048_004325 [Dryococelus australis]|uniref:Uncharacterized protein n=1 Tax=Dryococelus australis TaxID=614101 RepID=A0ABQ9I5L4_9NEOP|nr:hypothetical protein PR048_004325 [Dryococelus australis]